jgi:hypothetical protein
MEYGDFKELPRLSRRCEESDFIDEVNPKVLFK